MNSIESKSATLLLKMCVPRLACLLRKETQITLPQVVRLSGEFALKSLVFNLAYQERQYFQHHRVSCIHIFIKCPRLICHSKVSFFTYSEQRAPWQKEFRRIDYVFLLMKSPTLLVC